MSFFYSRFTFKLSFVFRFSTWKWLVSSGNHTTITISDGLKCFWFLIVLFLYRKVNHTWIIFPRSERSLPTKSVFKGILTKAFCQYILNLILNKKLGSFNDLIINTYFFNPSYVCHDIDMKIFWPASFVKFPLYYWTEFSQSWKDLMKTLRSHGNLQSLTDLINGTNIGTYSNSRDWLFWMLMKSAINPLKNKSMLFWKGL